MNESEERYDELMKRIKTTYEGFPAETKEKYKDEFERVLKGNAPFEDILLVRNLCRPEYRKAKQFKVISDGTPYGTEIYGPDGNKIGGIESATIEISGKEPLIKLTLRSRHVKLGLDGKMIMELNPPIGTEEV